MIKLSAFYRLLRLDKPIGIFLLLWPTLWALWIAAQGLPDWKVLVVFILGVIVMRSAGCVINDIADRKFDGQVERTQYRPLVTGEVSTKQAFIVFCLLCAIGLLLVLQLNQLTINLAFVALSLAILYPFMKRVTHFPQVVLGAAFGWAIPMAFAAQNNALVKEAWVLYIAAILWSIAYDSIYALMDKQDDIKAGIKSMVTYFGRYDITFICLAQAAVILSLVFIGVFSQLHGCYYAAVFLVLMLMAYQIVLIRRQQYLRAFRNNNWVGLVVFMGIVANYAI